MPVVARIAKQVAHLPPLSSDDAPEFFHAMSKNGFFQKVCVSCVPSFRLFIFFKKLRDPLHVLHHKKSNSTCFIFHVPTSDSVCVRAYLHQLPRSYVSIRTRVCIRVTIRHESSSKSKRGVRHHAPRHRHHAKRMCVFRYVRRNRWRGVMRVRSSIIMVRLPLVTLSTRRGEVLESGPGWNQ